MSLMKIEPNYAGIIFQKHFLQNEIIVGRGNESHGEQFDFLHYY